jgi:hypothetical protein
MMQEQMRQTSTRPLPFSKLWWEQHALQGLILLVCLSLGGLLLSMPRTPKATPVAPAPFPFAPPPSPSEIGPPPALSESGRPNAYVPPYMVPPVPRSR